MTSGPLSGVRIVEFDGLGPTPFAAMTLADMGAEVVRIARPGARHPLGLKHDILNRGRGYVELDLKSRDDLKTAIGLVQRADALIEGMRPGVMERLGLGPDVFEKTNPRLVYGRMTGWGQDGPLAQAAGHDINYIALSGALDAIGTAEAPVPPLNLLGDFGGGAMYLAFGIVCGIFEATRSGRGQIVDAAIVDGTAHLMAMMYSMRQAGLWPGGRAANLLDGGAHFYGVYRCKCGGFVSVGAIEPQFYALLIEKTGVDAEVFQSQLTARHWPKLKALLGAAFLDKTRAQWCEIMQGTDVCFAPVLSMDEAPDHPHNRARQIFVNHDGITQPAPAPRFSRTPGDICAASQSQPLQGAQILRLWQETESKGYVDGN